MFWTQKILYGSEWPILEVQRVKEPKSAKILLGTDSVADPECLSRMPDSNLIFMNPGSQISDLGSNNS